MVQSKALHLSTQSDDPTVSFLLEAGLLSSQQIQLASSEAVFANKSLIRYLIEESFLDGEAFARAAAKFMNLEWVDLKTISGGQIADGLLNREFIHRHRVLPIYFAPDKIVLAIAEFQQLELLPEIKFHLGHAIDPVFVAMKPLLQLIETFLNARHSKSLQNKNLSIDEENISKVVKEIFVDALTKNASDIHFEVARHHYQIRFRIDGLLHKRNQFSLEDGNRLISTLKILAKMDIAERRLPQDGRINLQELQLRARDCRVSSCPTIFGEKIVIRILENENKSLAIEELGMLPSQLELFLNALNKPQGMILVTGPTGSGKTNTLYSALKCLNTTDKNILTVEDPVEIELKGINQVQVNAKLQFTFPNILKTFLRQDPDVLMVGEIRDQETAEIAIKAAQTGHLVLSTVHSNNTIETYQRLQMLGISAFNFVHTVHLVVAQRLIRKLCDCCKKMLKVSAAQIPLITAEDQELISYEPHHCEQCNNGYRGRTAIFEILPIVPELYSAFSKDTVASEIRNIAKNYGFLDFKQSALEKVKQGVTSFAEIQRVIF